MKRRTFLKQCGLAASAIALSSAAQAGVKLSNNTINGMIGRRRPNIIFVMADDMGHSEIGCYGQTKIETPNIDQMAAEGMMFNQFYAANCICAPTRCGLMTGLHPGHATSRGNFEYNLSSENQEPQGYQLPLPAGTVTVAHILQKAGYKTGCMGKWGMGGPSSSGTPALMGFDHFYGYLGQVQAHDYYYATLWKDTEETELTLITNPGYSHDYMTEEALTFINKYKDHPFFLYLPYCIPHAQFEVPELGQYANKSGWTDNQKIYGAMMSRMDRDIGRVMDLVKSLGLDKDTIIMYCSDNGTSSFADFFGSNILPDGSGTLRAKKGWMYEGGIRTPLVVRWPGKIKPGTLTDHISAMWDFLPTCCDLAGVKVPKALWSQTGTWIDGPENKYKILVPDETSYNDSDGISFLPTLLGKDSLQKQHDYLYWELKDAHQTNTNQRAQAVRKGKWKLVRKRLREVPANWVSELYDLEADVAESNDLSASNPSKVAELIAIADAAHLTNPNFPLINGVDF